MKLDDNTLDYLLHKLPLCTIYKEGTKSSCVYHSDKTPSLFVYFDAKHHFQYWFKCHGCGETGSLNKLLKKLHGYHLLRDEVKFIPQNKKTFTKYEIDITLGFPRFYTYFRERGIIDTISKRFGFCMDFYHPGAVMPVYTDGLYKGYVRRNLNPTLPKYYISSGMDVANVIWGLDDVDESLPVYVTEGIIDAACLWSAGYQAVALISKESSKNKYFRLRKLCKPIFIPDNDKSGLRTASEFVRELGADVYFIPKEYKDVSEWRTKATNS